MDWIKWLIPLVVVFVVILSNLARIAQEEKKTGSRRRPGQGGPGDKPARPRRPQSDAERFLEEINRRRREAGELRKPVVVQRAPAPPPGPAGPKPARRETPSADAPMARSTPTRQAAPLPVAEAPMPSQRLPGQKAPEPQRRQTTPVLEEVVVATVVPSGNVSAGAPAAVIAAKPDTPTAVMLRQLLRDPQSIKAAFVLREVLDRPLCRRPPRLASRA